MTFRAQDSLKNQNPFDSTRDIWGCNTTTTTTTLLEEVEKNVETLLEGIDTHWIYVEKDMGTPWIGRPTIRGRRGDEVQVVGPS